MQGRPDAFYHEMNGGAVQRDQREFCPAHGKAPVPGFLGTGAMSRATRYQDSLIEYPLTWKFSFAPPVEQSSKP